MATVQELINRLEYLVDDDVSPEIAVMLFNMAQEDLSEVAGYTKIAETDFYRGADNINLPDDLVDLEEVMVRKSGETDYTKRILDAFVHKYEDLPPGSSEIERYELLDDVLYFKPRAPYNGSVRIKYYALLPEIPIEMNYRPKLRTAYHRAFPLYAAAKYMQNWKDELNAKQDFYSEYLEVKASLFQDTLERKQKTKSQFVIKTRGWY